MAGRTGDQAAGHCAGTRTLRTPSPRAAVTGSRGPTTIGSLAMSLDPTRPRDAVIAAGRERLLAHGIDALRSQLNASALSEDLPLSRDTAYRVFRDDESAESVTDAIVAAVAEATTDTAWAGSDSALADTMDAYQSSINRGNGPREHLIEALQAAFDAQFRSPGQPAGWMIQAVALTASSAWKGNPPDPDGVALAQRLLEIRRRQYATLTEQLTVLVTNAISELGRRPKPGIDPRSVVVLVHCLLDGAVLRRFIEPDAMPPDQFARVVELLWDGLSEPGSFYDPRRPDDERNQRVFDRVVDGAVDLWRMRAEISVDEAAGRAGVPPEAASLLFPEIGDLADSVVRTRVVGGGFADLGSLPDAARARQHLPVLVSALGRLRDLADTVPHAVAAAGAHAPTRSKPFADDFAAHESRAIDALGVAPNAERFVHDLVAFASQGTSGWRSVVALLRTIGYESDS